jgi:hypothetical protein
MARDPQPRDRRYVGTGRNLGDPPAIEPYPLKRGGRAVPDRSREPDRGAACHDTRKRVPPPAFTDELRSGVDIGLPVENDKSRQEHSNNTTEARHGQATRLPRPGQWA